VNIRQLQSFLTVVELQSFSKAARKLYMSQPAISLQIKTLEQQLGVVLLERSDRNIVLTPGGEVVLREAREIMDAYRRLEEGIEEIKGRKAGSVVIAASTVPGEYLLPGVIGGFQNAFPGIGVTMRICDTGRAVNLLLSRAADVGIVGADVSQEGLGCLEFYGDELVLIVPPGHACAGTTIKVKDLEKVEFILREPGSGTRQTFEELLARHGVDSENLKVVLEVGSTRAIITAVEEGLGVSVVSRLAAREALALGLVKAVTVEDLPMERALFVATRTRALRSPATGSFVQFLLEWSRLQESKSGGYK